MHNKKLSMFFFLYFFKITFFFSLFALQHETVKNSKIFQNLKSEIQLMHRDTIGGLLAILSAIISNFGINVQKYSHSQNEHISSSYLSSPLWWLGLFLVMVGSVGDFAAFGFATQALVASLGGGSTIVANVIIAHFFNHEHLYNTDLIGVLFIMIGTLSVALLTEPDQTLTLAELEARFVRPSRLHLFD